MKQQLLQQFQEDVDQIIDGRYRKEIQQFHAEQATLDNFSAYIEAIKHGVIIRQHYGVIGIRKLLDQPNNIMKIINAEIIPRLIYYIRQTQYLQLQYQAVWAITKIAAGSPHQCSYLVSRRVIPLMVGLLKSVHVRVVKQAMQGITTIALGDNQYRDEFIQEGAIAKLIEVYRRLKHQESIECCCRTISTLCSASFDLVHDGIQVVCQAISNEKMKNPSIISYCCEKISNGCQKGTQRLKLIIQSKIIAALVKILNGNEFKIIGTSLKTLKIISEKDKEVVNQLLLLDILSIIKRLIKFRTIRMKVNQLLFIIACGDQKQVKEIITYHLQLIDQVISNCQISISSIRNYLFRFITKLIRFGCPQPLFSLFVAKKIVKNFLRGIKSSKDPSLISCLDYLSALLSTGEQFKENGQNVLVNDLKQAGGVQLLQHLQANRNDLVFMITKMILDKFVY